MTASSIHPDAPDLGSASSDVGPALRRLAEAALGYAEAKGEAWSAQLKQVVEPDGPAEHAVTEGAKALVTGENPARAALRGAWSGADAKTKAAVIALLLLLLVLAPVLLLLLLLAFLVTALVLKARAAAAKSG